ncbi:MAG: ArgE/DapE family deacylase [Bacillota bacterium]
MIHTILEKEKQLILNEIENQKSELITFLQQLVAVPSDNPPGNCKTIAELTKVKLSHLGFRDAKLYEVPEDDAKKTGMVYAGNVVAFEDFNTIDGPEITLNSHGDVVPPGTGWTMDPYGGEIKDNCLYGRGAAVSKSDIASFTYAALALRKVSDKLKGKLSLAFTFDEETGGELGPKWLLQKKLIKPDLAICPGFSYSIINAHNGCLHLEINLYGKLAHAAEPFHGNDALEAMTDVLQALYKYRKELSHKKSAIEGIESPTMVVGLISGGINTNVVPDKCTIRLDRRLIPEEDPILIEEEIRSLIDQKVQEHKGIEVEISKVLLAKSFGPVEKNSTLVQSVVNNAKLLYNEDLPVHGSPLYTDARHFYEMEIPVILFGAGPKTLLEANGHRADEHVKIDDLIRATKIVALSLYDLLKK